MTNTSRDENAGHVRQQATGTTTGDKLSRTELNVLKTMISVITCFMTCWSVANTANFFPFFKMSKFTRHFQKIVVFPMCLFYFFLLGLYRTDI